MAKKKKVKKSVKQVKIDEDLVRKVDSLVEEIERTNNFKKITDEDIEELEATLTTKKLDPIEDKDLNIEEKEENTDNVEVSEKTEILDLVDDSEKKEKKKEKEDTEDIEDLELGKIGETQDLSAVKKGTKKKDLNITDSFEFKFDDERLRELDSLDTSFLEGRINSNNKVKKKQIKKVNDVIAKNVKEKESKPNNTRLILIIGSIIITAILLVICGSVLQVTNMRSEKVKESALESKKEEKKDNKEPVIDSHYLFVGDSLTLDYDIEESFSGYHLAVSGDEELTTTKLLENIRRYIYQYNPSKVIIQVGINDLLEDGEDNNIEENIKAIIKGIKENRPYAKIYIQSLYPINDSDDDKIEYKLIKDLYNNQIEKINNNIKNICKDNSVTYIDVYTALYNKKENMLDIEFTTNGFDLSEDGYKVVTRKIFEAINKD